MLEQALKEAHIASDPSRRALLMLHLELVVERNKQVNLTRITSPEDGVYLHVVDSLLLLDAFEKAPEGAFLDIGTGAGFPGIPLAIMTGRPATLIDSVGKKVAAVDDFVRALGLVKQIEVRHIRAEDLARTQQGTYALVVARAVAQTNVLVEYAAPLLMPRGCLVVAKARPSADEVAAGDRAAHLCGLKRVSRETYELPHDKGHREVLVYERVRAPRLRLPRTTGAAMRQPLGEVPKDSAMPR